MTLTLYSKAYQSRGGIYTFKKLQCIAEELGIPVSKKRKRDLFEEIRLWNSVRLLQAKFRFKRKKKEKKVLVPQNDTCPLSSKMVPCKEGIYLLSAGVCHGFHLPSLVDYIFSTGNLNNPITNVPYSAEDLKLMDILSTKHRLSFPVRLATIRENPPKEWEEKKVKESIFAAMENEVGDIVGKMHSFVIGEDTTSYLGILFTQFQEPFQQLYCIDQNGALENFIFNMEFLIGPSARPTAPNEALQRVICFMLSVKNSYHLDLPAQLLNRMHSIYRPQPLFLPASPLSFASSPTLAPLFESLVSALSPPSPSAVFSSPPTSPM